MSEKALPFRWRSAFWGISFADEFGFATLQPVVELQQREVDKQIASEQRGRAQQTANHRSVETANEQVLP